MKGIMFSPHLVNKILETTVGKEIQTCDLTGPYKVETRRLLTRQPTYTAPGFWWEYYPKRVVVCNGFQNVLDVAVQKARYKVGDEVYIKETTYVDRAGQFAGYVADNQGRHEEKKKSALFMPEAWARMKVVINSVDVVRVCDITQQQAWAEGFSSIEEFWTAFSTINGYPLRDMLAIFWQARAYSPIDYYDRRQPFLDGKPVDDVDREAMFSHAGDLCYAYKFTRTK